MDNEGLYLSYEELLVNLMLSGSAKIVQAVGTLANKTVDAGGDIYTYSGVAVWNVGSVVYQNGYSALVIELLATPNRIRINKTGTLNKIANGNVKEIHSDTIPQAIGEAQILEAMALIDEKTGQFFNKRSGTFLFEGNNTALLHLSVPIIEVEKLWINSTDIRLYEGEDKDFVAFKNRSRPVDDRRNPKIKLNVGKGRDSVFVNSLTSRIFVKNTLTKIEGSFGFLEPDGSTPALIKKATLMIVADALNKPVAKDQTDTGTTGPLKRLKVDLHEKEFFEPSFNKESTASSQTGNEEVDRIINMFRTPIRLGGSIQYRSSDRFSDSYYPF